MLVTTIKKCCRLHSNSSIETILSTEWSYEYELMVKKAIWTRLPSRTPTKFMRLCQNAMVMSHFKYGCVLDTKGKVDHIEGAKVRLKLYLKGGWKGDLKIKPGNTEWLTDVYNNAMMTFMLYDHPSGSLKKFEWDADARASQMEALLETYSIKFKDGKSISQGLIVRVGALSALEFNDPKHPKAHYQGLDRASPGRYVVEDEMLMEHHNDVL